MSDNVPDNRDTELKHDNTEKYCTTPVSFVMTTKYFSVLQTIHHILCLSDGQWRKLPGWRNHSVPSMKAFCWRLMLGNLGRACGLISIVPSA